jgi:uncharacterized protein YlxW (UPF0749 family)
VVPALISSILAYQGAGATAKEQAGEVKNKAESGYQFTREALYELRESAKQLAAQVARLEADVAAMKRSARNQLLLAGARRKAEATALATAAAVKAATPPPPPPAPLPGDLDKALLVQQAQAAKAPPAVP